MIKWGRKSASNGFFSGSQSIKGRAFFSLVMTGELGKEHGSLLECQPVEGVVRV